MLLYYKEYDILKSLHCEITKLLLNPTRRSVKIMNWLYAIIMLHNVFKWTLIRIPFYNTKTIYIYIYIYIMTDYW